MKIANAPKRIINDGLKDVIVKISYRPEFSKTALEHKIESGLSSIGYKYVKYSISNGKANTEGQKKQFIAVNEYKIIIEEEYLLFNIVDRYPGWANYFKFIIGILDFIPQSAYTGASDNYISSFNNLRIFDYLDNGMNLHAINDMIGSELKYSFAREYSEQIPAFVDVLLLNNKLVPRLQKEPISSINITVLCPAQDDWNRELLLDILSFVHKTEWEVFIETFNKSFFDEREAIYD